MMGAAAHRVGVGKPAGRWAYGSVTGPGTSHLGVGASIRAVRIAEHQSQRAGFAVEGRRRECLLVDGNVVDELYVAKLFPRPDH